MFYGRNATHAYVEMLRLKQAYIDYLKCLSLFV